MNNILKTILKLRWNVGYLCERTEQPWWNADLFGSASLNIFKAIYPRTSILAQYYALKETATTFHDEMLNRGTFHLFRLHEEIEQDLHKYIVDNISELSLKIPKNLEEALQEIKLLSKNKAKSKEGPHFIDGNASHIDGDMISKIADVYLMAFLEKKKSFPYIKDHAYEF